MNSDTLTEGDLQPSGIPNRDEEPIEDDCLYCLQSSFVFFQVENSMFCIPTYRFVDDSHVFTKLFKLPEPNARDVKGSSREQPIILPDISQKDFHNFLKALYPLTVSMHLKLSHVEWISVLRLSTLWYFLWYRNMAISSLEDRVELSPADKVVYGREFKIRTWIEKGYTEIVTRDETIDKEEATMLGFDTTIALFRIRESRQRGNLKSGDVVTTICKALKDELDLVGRSELGYRIDEHEVEAVEKAEDCGCEDGTLDGAASPFGLFSASNAFNFTPLDVAPATSESILKKKKKKKKYD